MEMQLQELIDKIKKDGVNEAEKQAEAIVTSAKEEAEAIIAAAGERAEKIMSDAKAENERLVKSSEEAIRQAGRNVLISFRESVNRELGAIMLENVSQVYASEQLAELIVKVIEGRKDSADTQDLSVILNDGDLKRLEESILLCIDERMKKGVTLKANNSFDGGFRIAVDGGKAYYDYSAEAVAEMMSGYLSPRIAALLKEAESNG